MTKKWVGIAKGIVPSALVIVSVVTSASAFAAQTGMNKVAPSAQTGMNAVTPSAQTGMNKVAPSAQTGMNKVAPSAQCQPEINLLDYTC